MKGCSLFLFVLLGTCAGCNSFADKTCCRDGLVHWPLARSARSFANGQPLASLRIPSALLSPRLRLRGGGLVHESSSEMSEGVTAIYDELQAKFCGLESNHSIDRFKAQQRLRRASVQQAKYASMIMDGLSAASRTEISEKVGWAPGIGYKGMATAIYDQVEDKIIPLPPEEDKTYLENVTDLFYAKHEGKLGEAGLNLSAECSRELADALSALEEGRPTPVHHTSKFGWLMKSVEEDLALSTAMVKNLTAKLREEKKAGKVQKRELVTRVFECEAITGEKVNMSMEVMKEPDMRWLDIKLPHEEYYNLSDSDELEAVTEVVQRGYDPCLLLSAPKNRPMTSEELERRRKYLAADPDQEWLRQANELLTTEERLEVWQQRLIMASLLHKHLTERVAGRSALTVEQIRQRSEDAFARQVLRSPTYNYTEHNTAKRTSVSTRGMRAPPDYAPYALGSYSGDCPIPCGSSSCFLCTLPLMPDELNPILPDKERSLKLEDRKRLEDARAKAFKGLSHAQVRRRDREAKNKVFTFEDSDEVAANTEAALRSKVVTSWLEADSPHIYLPVFEMEEYVEHPNGTQHVVDRYTSLTFLEKQKQQGGADEGLDLAEVEEMLAEEERMGNLVGKGEATFDEEEDESADERAVADGVLRLGAQDEDEDEESGPEVPAEPEDERALLEMLRAGKGGSERGEGRGSVGGDEGRHRGGGRGGGRQRRREEEEESVMMEEEEEEGEAEEEERARELERRGYVRAGVGNAGEKRRRGSAGTPGGKRGGGEEEEETGEAVLRKEGAETLLSGKKKRTEGDKDEGGKRRRKAGVSTPEKAGAKADAKAKEEEEEEEEEADGEEDEEWGLSPGELADLVGRGRREESSGSEVVRRAGLGLGREERGGVRRRLAGGVHGQGLDEEEDEDERARAKGGGEGEEAEERMAEMELSSLDSG